MYKINKNKLKLSLQYQQSYKHNIKVKCMRHFEKQDGEFVQSMISWADVFLHLKEILQHLE